jgi:gamma-glutamylcyclotransferase (GGCT)/AIG2-like uncharacterized protein YtfP
MTLIFAYGSNMDFAQMRERCPSATFVCKALLPEYRLAFTRKSVNRNCGVSDVVPEPSSIVWGVVYDVPDDEIPHLDIKEGVNSNSYVRHTGIVYQDGDESKALDVNIYFAVPQENPPLPNQEYKSLIVGGARHWNLLADYIAELEKIQVGS